MTKCLCVRVHSRCGGMSAFFFKKPICTKSPSSRAASATLSKFAIALPHRSRGGGSRRAQGSRSRVRAPPCPRKDCHGESPIGADPRARRSPVAGAVVLTHAAALAGRARPRGPFYVHRLRRGGEAPPSARGALGRSSRPASAAAPAGEEGRGGETESGVRACAQGALSHAPRTASARRWLRPRRGLARSARTRSLGGGARHAPERGGKPRAPGEESRDPAGAKSRENCLGCPATPPLRPPRATQPPAAGARCGDVTAGARARRRPPGAAGCGHLVSSGCAAQLAAGPIQIPKGFCKMSPGYPTLFIYLFLQRCRL